MFKKLFEKIAKKIAKIRAKRTFQVYGYEVKMFNIQHYGVVEYAQWLHPCETPKVLADSTIHFYELHIPKNSFAIDIGAHTGDTTVPMAIAAGHDGVVLALEPNPHVFKILEANAQLNKDKTNIIPLCFAATEEDGVFDFNYSDASFCNGGFFSKIKNAKHKHNHKLKVQGKNLVNYLTNHFSEHLQKLSFIKIDAEGYDKEIIKGLVPLLKQCRPTLVTECNKYLLKEERYELFNIFESLGGYKLFKIEDLEGCHHKQENFIGCPEKMLCWDHFDFIALPS